MTKGGFIMLTTYPACFFKEEHGYSVIFPDFEAGTCGDTLEDAISMSIDFLASYIYTSQQCNDEIPSASTIEQINIKKIADEIYDNKNEYSDSFVNLVSVDVEAYAKEHFEKSVKKTLTIPKWLNELALEQNINFSQVLQEALLAKVRL